MSTMIGKDYGNKLPDMDRRELRRILRALQTLQTLDEKMQLQQAVALLTIAVNEGASVGEISERTRMTHASTSRNIAALSEYHRKGTPGHNLVVSREDIMDRRVKKIVLTPKGRGFIYKLIEAVR